MPATGRTKAPIASAAREPLAYALGTRAKVACLRVLATTSASLTQRDVARRAGTQHRSSQLALDELVALGVVHRTQGGRDFLVRLNDSYYLSDTLRQIFRAEAQGFLTLRTGLAAVVSQIQRSARPLSVVLFGSVARGDDKPGSDLDILVISADAAGIETTLARLDTARDQLESRFGYALRPIAYTVSDARRRWRRHEPPLPEIVRDHIAIVGAPLRELLGG
ncbi:MAG: nucleotidyltransferase domain-containing protein [Gemmatimonadaceae bacterium]